MTTAGLYIHIPFCRTKCHYCSFNSYPCPDIPPEKYIDSLIIHARKFREIWGEAAGGITSIFLGGGTPTIYSSNHIDRLLHACRAIFSVAAQAEQSVETNPNTVSAAGLDLLLKAGINRLSIGVQAFDDKLLAVLGRSHSAKEARQAVSMVQEAGFANVNIDLMYGLPGQTAAIFKKSLEQALALEVQHIALYELTIEEHTPFALRQKTGDLGLPDESEIIRMEEMVQTLLPANGYQRYEISNYAKKGYVCQHNINYWQNDAYFGIGAGAVSYLDGIRLKNIDNPADYVSLMASMQVYEYAECLSSEAAFRESIIMGLRMLQGVDLHSLKKRFDLNPIEYYGKTLEKLLADQLVVIDGEYMKLTPKALPVANQVLSELV
jgi:oxygen-independent coproporphyrinogen-3 oxidase